MVNGDSTQTFPWPQEYNQYPKWTPTQDGRLLGTVGYRVVEIGKADHPLERTVTKRWIANRYLGDVPVFLATDETVFIGGSQGKLIH